MHAANHAFAVDLSEHQRVGPSRLDHVNLDLNRLQLRIFNIMRTTSIRNPLRPQTQDNFLANLPLNLSRGERQIQHTTLDPGINLNANARTLLNQLALDEIHRRRTNKPCDKEVRRRIINILRRPKLLHNPILHDRDPIAQRHRLDLIMRHINDRRPKALMQQLDLRAHLNPQFRIEI